MDKFIWIPDNTIETEVQFDTIVSEFDLGYEERINRRDIPLNRFVLYFKNRAQSEILEIRDFFKTQKGKTKAFYWENPDDSVLYTVRFDTDSLKDTRKAFNVYDMSFPFMEARA